VVDGFANNLTRQLVPTIIEIASSAHSTPGSWMAVVRRPEPSMPTPTIPKRTGHWPATASCDANNGSESRKIRGSQRGSRGCLQEFTARKTIPLHACDLLQRFFRKSALRDLKIRGVPFLGNADKPHF